jgi:hypothetical protein
VLEYRFAPVGWQSDHPNPFAADGMYGDSWSCFSTLGTPDYDYLTCRTISGCWLFKLTIARVDYTTRLIDFVRYENKNGRTVIIETSSGVATASHIEALEKQTPSPGIIRDSDEPFLVHSTDATAWRKIQSAGELTATAFLSTGRNKSDPSDETAEYMRHEPPEYKEHIMFGSVSTTSTEVVVSAFQKKKMVLREDVEYDPGARIYIDNHTLIRDGLDVRDGLHTMKVHGHLSLKYMAAVVTVDDVEMPHGLHRWTPRTFTEKANELFRARMKEG